MQSQACTRRCTQVHMNARAEERTLADEAVAVPVEDPEGFLHLHQQVVRLILLPACATLQLLAREPVRHQRQEVRETDSPVT